MSGLTNIFKAESNSVIPLKRNTIDSKSKLSAFNLDAVETLKQSSEESKEINETDEKVQAKRKVFRRHNGNF